MNKHQQRILLRYIADKEELKGLSNKAVARKTGASMKAVLAMSQPAALAEYGSSLNALSLGQINAIRLALGRRRELEERSKRSDLPERLGTSTRLAIAWVRELREGKKPRPNRGTRPAISNEERRAMEVSGKINQWLMRPLISGRYYVDQEAA